MKFPKDIIDMQNQMRELSRLGNPAWFDMYDQMEKTLAPVRRDIELMERIKRENAAIHVHELAGAHQSLVEMAEKAMVTYDWAKHINDIHSTWSHQIQPIQNNIQELTALGTSMSETISRQFALTERMFAGIDFDAIHKAFDLPNNSVIQAQAALSDITASYETLVNSISEVGNIVNLPSFTFPYAGRELFMSGYAVKNIYPEPVELDEEETLIIEDIKHDDAICISLLREVNISFEKAYVGACESLESRNPDKARHFFASLRELWNHLLRELAPDEIVINWVPSEKSHFLHKGKPTRPARLHYICRNINNGFFVDFVDKDTKAFIEYYNIFQRVHELDTDISNEQLQTLLLRTQSWLMYILKIWKET